MEPYQVDAAFVAAVVVVVYAIAVTFAHFRVLRQLAARDAEITDLRNLTHRDALTGLGNRRMFDHSIGVLVAHALRGREPLGFLVVDIDGLKQVNDGRGHQVGDLLIREVANVLQRSVRPTDVVCRVGGDEFFILLTACDEEKLGVVIDRIRRNLELSRVIDGDTAIIPCASIGGTRLYARGADVYIGEMNVGAARNRGTAANAANLLVNTGDQAMYRAKSHKDGTTVHSVVI